MNAYPRKFEPGQEQSVSKSRLATCTGTIGCYKQDQPYFTKGNFVKNKATHSIDV